MRTKRSVKKTKSKSKLFIYSLYTVILVGLVALGVVATYRTADTGAEAAYPGFQDDLDPLESEEATTNTTSPTAYVKPNIVLIMTDDQDYASMEKMPHTNRLIGDQGTRFNNSFSNTPLCCPSRSNMLTGQFTHNHEVWANKVDNAHGYQLLDHTKALPVWLQEAGYRTVLIGKFLNGYGQVSPLVVPGWTEWYGTVGLTTYRYYNFRMYEKRGSAAGRKVLYAPDPNNPDKNYQTDVETDKAVDFINRSKNSSTPFFMWVSYLAPHIQLGTNGGPLPAPRHKGMFANEPLPMSPSFNEADVSDKPQAIQRLRSFTSEDINDITVRYRNRLESLQAVDEGVKRIVETLEATGKLDNTWVIFTSDNGYVMGAHRIKNAKTVVYDESTKVPLLIRGPGAKVQTRDELVLTTDVSLTIARLARARRGGHNNKPTDGMNLRPLLRDGRNFPWRKSILIEGDSMNYNALRTATELYVEYPKTGETEYYDLVKDPYLLNNLKNPPAQSSIEMPLPDKLHLLMACSGSNCRR